MNRDALQRPLAIALALLAAASWFNADFFGHELLAEVAVFAIFAMSLDLIVGYAGMVSLGHAAFLAVGAYATAALSVFLGWPMSLTMVVTVALTAGIAALVGMFAVRLSGVFFIMITLAIGQMFYAYFFKNREFGADDGMSGIPRLDLSPIGLDANDPTVFSALALLAVAVVYLLLRRIVRSPFGCMLIAIHQNENRVRSLGAPVRRYKLAAYVLSGTVAGLAGSLMAQHTSFISPDIAFWTVSGEVLIMVIVGGMGSLLGPALGAALIILMRHELSDESLWQAIGLPGVIASYWQFVMGIFFVLVVLFASDGVYGRGVWLLNRVRERLPGAPARNGGSPP